MVVVGLLAFAVASFLEDTVTEGEAYGFRIGENHAQAHDRARHLVRSGAAASLHRGRGSALLPFDAESPDTAFEDSHWKLVVDPDWWNDSISFTFEGDSLVEIYRFRFCCELP